MDLYEVCLEVIGDGLVFIRPFAVRRDAVGKVAPVSGRSLKRETNGRTIWRLGFPVPISSSTDRFYLLPVMSIQRI